MASTCSPCTMISFNSSFRGLGCTVVEDAHAIFSPSARLSASRQKISKPDTHVTVNSPRCTTLTEIGFGTPSLRDFEQPECQNQERNTDLMIGSLSPLDILYHISMLPTILLIAWLVFMNFPSKSSALPTFFPLNTVSKKSLSWATLTRFGSSGFRSRFDVMYWLIMVLTSSSVKSPSGLVCFTCQQSGRQVGYVETHSSPMRWKTAAQTRPGFRRRVTCRSQRCSPALPICWACTSSCFTLYASTSFKVT